MVKDMKKFEIEIDCPEGWEPVAFRDVADGEQYLTKDGLVAKRISVGLVEPRLIVRRAKKKYSPNASLQNGDMPRGEFRANVYRDCPVDPDASIVSAFLKNGNRTCGIARDINWEDAVAWTFNGLADGYEW